MSSFYFQIVLHCIFGTLHTATHVEHIVPHKTIHTCICDTISRFCHTCICDTISRFCHTCICDTISRFCHTCICDTISRFMLIIFKYMTTCNIHIHIHVTVCVGLKKVHANILQCTCPTNLAILAQSCKVRLHHVKFPAFLNLLKLTYCLQLQISSTV